MKEQKVVEQRKKVMARFIYNVGVPVVRLFNTKEDAEWAAHCEGDHLKYMEIINGN